MDIRIYETWESIKKTLRSRNENEDFETFFRHYWLSKYEKTTKGDLFNSFKRQIAENEESYLNFVDDLEDAVKIYMKIVCPRNEDYGNRKQYFWLPQSLKSIEQTFKVKQARIVLLALLELKTAKKLLTNNLSAQLHTLKTLFLPILRF